MRKFLLSACAAVIALSASAQIKTVKEHAFIKPSVKLSEVMSSDIAAPAKLTFGNPNKTVAKKAPARIAHDGIYGLYIIASTDYTLENAGCDSLLIERCNETFEGGQTVDTKITFCHETLPMVVYGKYDAAANTITCPFGQYVAEYVGTLNDGTPVDWNIYLGSWVGDDIDSATFSEDDVVFDVDEDGAISLEPFGLAFPIDENNAGVWKNIFSVDIRPANAVISYTRTIGQTETEYANAAYVEDFETIANVYGYAWFPGTSGFGLSCVATMDINTETKDVTYKALQNCWSTSSLGVTEEEAGDWFMTYGTKSGEDPKMVYFDDSDNAVNTGIVEGNQIKMNPQPIATKLWNDPSTGELSGYMMWLSDLVITLDEGNFLADSGSGIANVNSQKSAKAGKTYNVFGQEVSAATKGLVIRNGKKFFNK